MLDDAVRNFLASLPGQENGYMFCQISSFDQYMEEFMPYILEETLNSSQSNIISKDSTYTYSLRLFKTRIRPPFDEANGRRLTPCDAKLRRMTYSARISLDVKYVMSDNSGRVLFEKIVRDVELYKQPIMVGSGYDLKNRKTRVTEDPLDCGGYFVVGGHQKVFVGQERLATNRAHVWKCSSSNPNDYEVEVRSRNPDKHRSTSTTKFMLKCDASRIPTVVVQLPFVPLDVSIPTLITALVGEWDETRFINTVCSTSSGVELNKCFVQSVVQTFKVYDDPREALHKAARDASALNYVSEELDEKQRSVREAGYVKHIIDNETFPHLNGASSSEDKYRFVCHMFRKIIRVHLGLSKPDNRDSYVSRRIDTCGILFALQLRQLARDYKKWMFQNFRASIKSERLDIRSVTSSKILTGGFTWRIGCGRWGQGWSRGQSGHASSAQDQQKGVIQANTTNSMVSRIDALCQTAVTVADKAKATSYRVLDPSAYGFICSHTTPEGRQCGLNRRIACTAMVRPYYRNDIVKRSCTLASSKFADPAGDGFLLLNGAYFIRFSCPVEQVVSSLRSARSHGLIPIYSSIVVCEDCDRSVSVNTDHGAVVRPLIVASKLQESGGEERLCEMLQDSCAPWSSLLRRLVHSGFVEYVDSEEINRYVVAEFATELNHEHTHLEFCSGLSLVGATVAMQPMLEHQPPARTTYMASMVKQAVGMDSQRVLTGFGLSHRMLHLERRLVCVPSFERVLKLDQQPIGINCMVAILNDEQKTSEDAIQVSESFVQRGGFNSFEQRTEFITLKGARRRTNASSTPCLGRIVGRRSNLNPETGVIKVGSRLDPNTSEVVCDAFAEVCSETDNGAVLNGVRDRSFTIRGGGVVDATVITRDSEDDEIVVVRSNLFRKLEMGDKLTNFSAQKGVVVITADSDMPYDSVTGIPVDIVINRHSFTRSTVGQYMELRDTQLATLRAERVDSTSFPEGGRNVQEANSEMIAAGLDPYGYKRVFRDGAPVRSMIACGMAYMHRLFHYSGNKLGVRARGSVNAKSRQPLEGRAKDGGYKVGEMELDVLGAHGAASFIYERLFLQSDASATYVCALHGILAVPPRHSSMKQPRSSVCHLCGHGSECVRVALPWSLLQFIYNMEDSGVSVKLNLSDV